MTLRISRILHAGYVFECEGTLIAFDPIFENPFSRNCHAFPDVRFDHAQIRGMKPDAVFISHFHDDHCSMESLDLLDRDTPIYLYCLFDELFAMIRELGFVNVLPLKVDAPVQVGAIEVIPRKALDSDVDSMFHIRAAGLNVLNVVDSWMDRKRWSSSSPTRRGTWCCGRSRPCARSTSSRRRARRATRPRCRKSGRSSCRRWRRATWCRDRK